MQNDHPRMARENKTIQTMIAIYCRGHHGTGDSLCRECRWLLDYATVRLQKCPFQERKTTCARCPVHCYKPALREEVREVMRYSGPLMTFRHPVLALFHFIDGLRKNPRRVRHN